MKRTKKILIIALVIFLILCHIDFRPWFYEKQREYLNPVDDTRKSYNIGTCLNMKEDLCYYIIYLNDKESQWTKNDKGIFENNKFITSIKYLSEQASAYGVTLETHYEICDTTATYEGILESNVVENGVQNDILMQVAESLGYEDAKQMNNSLKKELSVKQVAYLIAVNKEGRSFKHIHAPSSIERQQEFCVFFSPSIVYTDTTCESTIAHEILHLFGAEDFYDPYGKYPERKKLAEVLYPDDIMLKNSTDINDVNIGSYTAYSVGWLNELPDECNTENWWK